MGLFYIIMGVVLLVALTLFSPVIILILAMLHAIFTSL